MIKIYDSSRTSIVFPSAVLRIEGHYCTKRRILEIGGQAWRREGERLEGRQEIYDRTKSPDSLLQNLRYRRSQTLRCEYVTATEHRLRSEYREEGKKKSRTTSFLQAMRLRRERGRGRKKEREEGKESSANSYPALMPLGFDFDLRFYDDGGRGRSIFDRSRETGREIKISFSLGPPMLFGP